MSNNKDDIANALHALSSSGKHAYSSKPAQSMPVPNPEPKARLQPELLQPDTEKGIEMPSVPKMVPNTPQPANRKATIRRNQLGSVAVRQTLIPSCLISGVLLVGFCIYYYLQPETASIRYLEQTWPIGIGIVGIVCLGLGVVNMIIVKNQQKTQ